MADTDADTPPPARKPGFLRRLFGGGAPAADVPVAPEPAADRAEETPAPGHDLPGSPEAPAEAALAEAALPDAGTPFAAAPFEPAEDEAASPPEEPAPVSDAAPDMASMAVVDHEAEVAAGEPKTSWWNRLKQGLSRSSSSIGQGIVDLFAKRKLDATTLEDLDDILIRADLGVATAGRITEAVGRGRYNKQIDPEEVRAILAQEVERVLEPLAVPLAVDRDRTPFTVLMVGVNGSGKTTTIGKLAAKLRDDGHSVMLAAGDTFRAAAIEQLRVWGDRTGAPVIARPQGADAAGLAFDAFKAAREAGTDVLLVDTAGRLQNRTELMDELAKVTRVLRKLDADAPHAVLLVLDATVGQNALSQVEIFSRVAGVTGLVMTKLDGTARGGILVAIAEKFGLPIHFIGVGETVDDLQSFSARDFARAIAGLDEA